MAYWSEALDSHSSDLLRQAFAQSSEYQAAIKGKSMAEVVNGIYMNLFARHADIAGLDFYVKALQAGSIGVDAVVADVMRGARGNDAEVFENKLVAANLFTAALELSPDYRHMYTAQNPGFGKSYLASVTTDASAFEALSGLLHLFNTGPVMTVALIGATPADQGFWPG